MPPASGNDSSAGADRGRRARLRPPCRSPLCERTVASWALLRSRFLRFLPNSPLSQDAVDHIPVHVGESAADAVVVVGQALVVKAEELEHSSVEIVDFDGLVRHLVADIVCGPIPESGL